MSRKRKQLESKQEMIARFITRNYNQELAGQTKQKHYRLTKANQINCEICLKEDTKLHRHRIIPGGEYTNENVIIVCVKCHKLIHRIINELEKTEQMFRLAIVIAKTELNNG